MTTLAQSYVLKKNDKNSEPNPEVVAKPKYRTFTLDYKWSIVEQADACTKPGELGALLRREGLYHSLLSKWRMAFESAGKEALKPAKRGPKPKSKQDTTQNKEVQRLQKENARLQVQLKQAEIIIDVQKKVSELLGIVLPTDPNNENA